MLHSKRIQKLSAEIRVRQFTIQAGVSEALGGEDDAPNPHELLEAALAACTTITVQMYANRKQWNLISTDVTIEITSEEKGETQISRKIDFKGELTNEQKQQLLVIAGKCPIHKLLTGKVIINDQLLTN